MDSERVPMGLKFRHKPELSYVFADKQSCRISVKEDSRVNCGYSVGAVDVYGVEFSWPLDMFFSPSFHDKLIDDGDGEFLEAMWHDVALEIEARFKKMKEARVSGD